MAKRKYIKMELTQVEMEPSGILMKGSKTSVSIKVNSVEVEPFERGFTGANDFQELSFD